jgi:membrane-bound metal-dependent hydrolase YbcI (DUF457 family)
MKSPAFASCRRFTCALLALCALPAVALAQNEPGNFAAEPIPTLGGIGLASLVGAFAIGGAWLLSRNRGKVE